MNEILCYAWRGDNYGPGGLNETLLDWTLFGQAFPNAEIKSSTFNEYFLLLNEDSIKNALPRLTSEIGDSWMYGVPSDPYKVSGFTFII